MFKIKTLIENVKDRKTLVWITLHMIKTENDENVIFQRIKHLSG